MADDVASDEVAKDTPHHNVRGKVPACHNAAGADRRRETIGAQPGKPPRILVCDDPCQSEGGRCVTRWESTGERVIAGPVRPEPSGSVAMVGTFAVGHQLHNSGDD